jgi:Zn-finger nucleic acid-binding protein
MELVTFGAVEIDRCLRCRGVWFDLREEEHLKSMPGSEALDVGLPEVGELYDEVRDYDCPRCETRLLKMVDAEKDVRYESCSICHGLFFDAGELRELKEAKFVHFVQSWFPRSFRP